MGSFGAGLASVGGSIAEAQEIRRQRQLEDIKTALEQRRLDLEQKQLGISGTYANIAGIKEKREQAQFEEQQRLSRLPKFVGYRVVGGRLYAGMQYPDGTLKTQEVTGTDSAQDVQALENEISALPTEAQDAARATVSPYIQAQDYPAARAALKPIMQKYSESLLPGQQTVTDTTVIQQLDTPQGPKIVQIPKQTIQRKVPAPGRGVVGGLSFGAPVASAVAGPVQKTRTSAAAPGVQTPKHIASPPAPKSPSQVAKDLGLPTGAKVLGAKPPSRAEISKVIDPVGDADKRYKVMLDAAKNPNSQNDVAMLFNHIGMTLSAQRGARITSAEIQRAIEARSLGEDITALYQKLLNGQFLTPGQRQHMLALGKLNREFIWQQAWEKAKAEKMAQYLPRTLPGLPPVQGVYFVGEDVPLKTGGKARIVQINPDGSYEVKPY